MAYLLKLISIKKFRAVKNSEIKIAKTESDILKCWDVIKALRPHLDKNVFVSTVTAMINEGYTLAFIEEDGIAVAAIGYRYLQLLYNGKQYYIDDLSTLPGYRGKGYAGMLLDYVETKAKEKGFNVVTLDSGYQRFDAHRLYLNKGFVISCHHFSKTI
ncbi:MAG: GNAT family N-acetyltransferase [Bacteroidetes bacterium]|nr:GNAT family N-acetyltransferase [Bacteroidota bacterium]